MDFVHLHLHTTYSILNGVCKIDKLSDYIKKIGQKAAAITDHGNLFGAVNFYENMKKRDIKPIIGCELYLTFNSGFENKTNDSLYHIVVLCENKIGYKNLAKIVSLSYLEGFFEFPRVDLKTLKKYKEGLIILSGCSKGEIYKNLEYGRYEKAKTAALKYKDIFGKDNFFLELQNFGSKKEEKIIDSFINLSKDVGLKVVATNNVHYIEKKDVFASKILYCIKNSKLIDNLQEKYFNGEKYLKTAYEMKNLFTNCEDALKNTVEIAFRCEFVFEFGKINIPKFEFCDGKTSKDFLIEKAKKGLIKKYGKKPSKEILKRFNYEIEVVDSMGFIDYFLIVYDYVNYAKKNGIFVGPGRGSGAGSLLGFCLEITEVDPIKYDLSFERFLNIYRTKMPDFDVDFCNERRQEVIDYVIKKYGKERVFKIITFGTLGAKAALRDVGRVLGFSYSFVDRVVKLIPVDSGIKLEDAFKESEKFREVIYKSRDVNRLFKTAKVVEGLLKNTSIHAAAIVIVKKELDGFLPVFMHDNIVTTQYAMEDIEKLGFLKMDFLGLRNLTIMEKCEKLIKKKDRNFSISKIELFDKKTYNMLSMGDSIGVFQMESYGMRMTLKKAKPSSLEDIMAILALYRPGPSQFIDSFIKNKNNPKNIKYLNYKIKNILKSTYGVIVYQEQVMKIFKDIAGYSYKRIDYIRDIISKKKTYYMKKEREFFIYGKEDEDELLSCCGALKNGIDIKVAAIFFDSLCKFSSYAYNKSHAAAYSLISYKTAYLKCNYFLEYMVALINTVLDNKDKLSLYIKECENKNINILKVSVNESEAFFEIKNESSIRYGFLGLKNINRNFIDVIVSERKYAFYSSFEDFLYRILKANNYKDNNKKSIMELIDYGAFDEFNESRDYMKNKCFDFFNNVIFKKKEISGQISFFEDGNNFKYIKKNNFLQNINLTGTIENIFFSKNLKYKEYVIIKLNVREKIFNILFLYDKFVEFEKKIKMGRRISIFCHLEKICSKKFIFLDNIIKIEETVLFIILNKDNVKKLNFAISLLKKNIGSTKVLFLNYRNNNRYFKNKNINGVNITKNIIFDLEKILGKGNVYVDLLDIDKDKK